MANFRFQLAQLLCSTVGFALLAAAAGPAHAGGRVTAGDTQLAVPQGVTIHESCGDSEERTRLIWAVRYMRAASRSRAFVHCLALAVTKLQPLETAQESIWVGPYFACKGPPGSDHRDPEFVQANRRLAFEAAVALAQTQHRPLVLRCGFANGDTAAALTEYDYFDSNLAEPEVIEVSLNVFSQYPAHQQGWVSPPEHGNLGPSYPVDELAGIILHERLHTRGFEHGNEDTNNCGYTSGFNCPAGGSPANCRMRSLNEIVEGCMSESVEDSVTWCPTLGVTCADPNAFPIYLKHLNSVTSPRCECIPWH
jgi:hypothetical protein